MISLEANARVVGKGSRVMGEPVGLILLGGNLSRLTALLVGRVAACWQGGWFGYPTTRALEGLDAIAELPMNALLSGKQKWRSFATAKQVPLLFVRWSFLILVYDRLPLTGLVITHHPRL